MPYGVVAQLTILEQLRQCAHDVAVSHAARHAVLVERTARLVFISIIPAGLIGTMPVASTIGSVSPTWLVLAGCGCAMAAIVTLLHWKLALMRYSSASS